MNGVNPVRWEVRGFYNERGRQPGHLACHTWHKAEVSRDTEIAAFRSRKDIGRIEVREANGAWRPA
jgi:hypothetical protein